jgi:hypothetical protein
MTESQLHETVWKNSRTEPSVEGVGEPQNGKIGWKNVEKAFLSELRWEPELQEA